MNDKFVFLGRLKSTFLSCRLDPRTARWVEIIQVHNFILLSKAYPVSQKIFSDEKQKPIFISSFFFFVPLKENGEGDFFPSCQLPCLDAS